MEGEGGARKDANERAVDGSFDNVGRSIFPSSFSWSVHALEELPYRDEDANPREMCLFGVRFQSESQKKRRRRLINRLALQIFLVLSIFHGNQSPPSSKLRTRIGLFVFPLCGKLCANERRKSVLFERKGRCREIRNSRLRVIRWLVFLYLLRWTLCRNGQISHEFLTPIGTGHIRNDVTRNAIVEVSFIAHLFVVKFISPSPQFSR